MLFNNKAGNIWHYKVLLPIEKESNIITISEGSTPLINLDNLGEKYGLKSLFIKDETRNSTASFKDRPTSVAISKAKELGYSTITLSSSGNAAAAAAAYAARGNMKSVIFVPENTA